jgi:hypothetical protein
MGYGSRANDQDDSDDDQDDGQEQDKALLSIARAEVEPGAPSGEEVKVAMLCGVQDMLYTSWSSARCPQNDLEGVRGWAGLLIASAGGFGYTQAVPGLLSQGSHEAQRARADDRSQEKGL